MAQQLRKKLKRTLKSGKVSVRDMSILISEYFSDAHHVDDMSPLDIQQESTHPDLLHNYFMARAYFANKFNLTIPVGQRPKPQHGVLYVRPINTEKNEPPYMVERFDMGSMEWKQVHEPKPVGYQSLDEFDEIETTIHYGENKTKD